MFDSLGTPLDWDKRESCPWEELVVKLRGFKMTDFEFDVGGRRYEKVGPPYEIIIIDSVKDGTVTFQHFSF